MGRYAYAAIAAAAEVDEGPTDWPDGWTWPPDSSGPWPPGFITAHADFTTPSPADDALAVDIDADFSWTFAYTIDGVAYSADSFEILIDDVVVGTSSTADFDPGTLDAGADFTWRVVAYIGAAKYVGPEWSFRTSASLSGEASATSSATGSAIITVPVTLNDAFLYRLDLTYRPTTTYIFYYTGPEGPGAVSSYYGYEGNKYVIHRRYYSFNIPAGIAPASVKLRIYLRCDAQHNTAFTIQCYSSNTDFYPLDSGDWGHLDNLESSVLVSSVVTAGGGRAAYEFPVDAARVIANAGARMWFIIASKEDVDDIMPSLGPPDKFVWLYALASLRLD